jgi:hypothetical protein
MSLSKDNIKKHWCLSRVKDIVKSVTGYSRLRSRLQDEFIKSILYPYALESSISIEEARFLTKIVKEADEFEGPIIEIGTLFGGSTLVIINAKKAMRKFITVDNFRWNPAGLDRNVHKDITNKKISEAIEKYSVELIDSDKLDFYENYSDPPPSLVFFDADHSYEGTLEDLLWAKNIGAKIISGHDYSEQHPGVMKAVNEVFKKEPGYLCGSLFVI